jgi:hypothetical protein
VLDERHDLARRARDADLGLQLAHDGRRIRRSAEAILRHA